MIETITAHYHGRVLTEPSGDLVRIAMDSADWEQDVLALEELSPCDVQKAKPGASLCFVHGRSVDSLGRRVSFQRWDVGKCQAEDVELS